MSAPEASCPGECDCAPTGPGYFWATHRKYGWRRLVLVEKNGFGYLRVFVHRMGGSFGLEDFKDYKGPLTEQEPDTTHDAKE